MAEDLDWERACSAVETVLREALNVIEADADPLIARAAKAYRLTIGGLPPAPASFADARLAPSAEEFSSVDPALPGAIDGVDSDHTGSVS